MLSTFLLSDCIDVISKLSLWFYIFTVQHTFLHINHYFWKFDFMTLTWFPMTYVSMYRLSINLNWMAIVRFKFQSSFLFFGPFQFWCELFYFYLDWANGFIDLGLVIFVYPGSRKYGNPNQNKNGQSVNHSADVCQQIHCWKMKCENFGYYSNYLNLELYSIVITIYHLWFLNLPTANFRDSTKSSTRKTPLSFLSRVFTLVASRSVSSNTLSEEIVVSVSRYF